jgi:hypothetical protein
MLHGAVKYREAVIDFGQFWKPFEPYLTERLNRPEFFKRPNYSHQKEYRFVLYLVSGLKILPLRDDLPLDISSDFLAAEPFCL